MNTDVKLTLIPSSVMNALKARDVNMTDFANGVKAARDKLSVREQALLKACQMYQPITKHLGTIGWLPDDYSDITPERETKYKTIDLMANSEEITKELDNAFGGASHGEASVAVIQLAPKHIGIVITDGAVESLSRDNNVLALLKAIVAYGLTFVRYDQLFKTGLSGVMERFAVVSAYANIESRPPAPVFK